MSSHHSHSTPSKAKKRVYRCEDDDDKWMMDTPKRRPTKAGARGSVGSTISSVEKKTGTAAAAAVVASVMAETMAIGGGGGVGSDMPVLLESLTTTTPTHASCMFNTRSEAARCGAEKQKQQRQKKLQTQLNATRLKKDILKERSHLERELQIQIQKELSAELATRCKQQIKQESSTIKPGQMGVAAAATATAAEKGGSARKITTSTFKANNHKGQKHANNASKVSAMCTVKQQ